MDSDYRDGVHAVLDRLGQSQVGQQPALAYARGYLLVRSGDPESATTWFASAQAAQPFPALEARIAAELGYVLLDQGHTVATEAVLLSAEGKAHGRGNDAEPDLLLLRALLADRNGQRGLARDLYRQCLLVAHEALTPFTEVLALLNLTVAIAHIDPHEAVALGRLALTQRAAQRLNSRMVAALKNALGYALLCVGRFEEAQANLEDAATRAAAEQNGRIEKFARFNLAIAYELRGDLELAREGLNELLRRTEDGEDDFRRWVSLRANWLGLGSHPPSRGSQTRGSPHDGEFAAAANQLEAIRAVHAHSYAVAREALRLQRATYAARDDDLSRFVTELWLAYVESRSGRERAARRLVASATELGRARRFVLSPNWWDADVIDTARHLASDSAARTFLGALWQPSQTSRHGAVPGVVIRRSGHVTVNGREVDGNCWRQGRTGARVLRRLFGILVAAYPHSVGRDELADLLWPDSEGDRAIGNLYAATHDLRNAVADMPGVSIVVDTGMYGLKMDVNVRLLSLEAIDRIVDDHSSV